jgi:putative hemolysin
MTIVDQILLILFCMAMMAFLSGIETGVVSIHRLQLQHLVRRRDKPAMLLQEYLNDTDRLLGTTLVGTNLGMVAVGVLSVSLVKGLPGGWAETIVTLLDTVILVVFCEYLPKAWFYSKPLERSRMFASALRSAEVVFKPVAVTVVWITKALVRGRARNSLPRSASFVTREDLKMLVTEGEEAGSISASNRAMIHNVLELSGKTAKQIMIPREKMAIAYTDTTIPEFLELARGSRFTRLPVFDREKGQFAGIVNMFFVVSADPQTSGSTIAGFVRKALFISETTPVDEILPMMRRARQPMCLVTDKESNVTGLITSRDIAREVVGRE